MSSTSSPGGAGVPPQLDTSEAHSARVWNYLLGGKDNKTSHGSLTWAYVL